jgi:hypothetical protein
VAPGWAGMVASGGAILLVVVVGLVAWIVMQRRK